MNTIAIDELGGKIAAYFRNKKDVIAVYLFGSYAQGKERDSSDIDLGLLLDTQRETNSNDSYYYRRNDYLVELSRIVRKDIDIVILNSAGLELLKQIFTRGKCLLVNDAKKLASYRMVMFAEMADFGYYKGKMQKGLLKKIMEG